MLIMTFAVSADNELAVYDVTYMVGDSEIHTAAEAAGNTVAVSSSFMPEKGIAVPNVIIITAGYVGDRLACVAYNPYTVSAQNNNYDIIQSKSYSITVPGGVTSLNTLFWAPGMKPLSKSIKMSDYSTDNTIKSAFVEIGGTKFYADIDNWYNTIDFDINRAYATDTNKTPTLVKSIDDDTYMAALETFAPSFSVASGAAITAGNGAQNYTEPYSLTVTAASGDERTYTVTVKDTVTIFDASFDAANGVVSANADGLKPVFVKANASSTPLTPSAGPADGAVTPDTMYFNTAPGKFLLKAENANGAAANLALIGGTNPKTYPKKIIMEYRMYVNMGNAAGIDFVAPFNLSTKVKPSIAIRKDGALYMNRHSTSVGADTARNNYISTFPLSKWVDVKMIFWQEQETDSQSVTVCNKKYALYIDGKHIATDKLKFDTSVEAWNNTSNGLFDTKNLAAIYMQTTDESRYWFGADSNTVYDLYIENIKMSYSK